MHFYFPLSNRLTSLAVIIAFASVVTIAATNFIAHTAVSQRGQGQSSNGCGLTGQSGVATSYPLGFVGEATSSNALPSRVSAQVKVKWYPISLQVAAFIKEIHDIIS